VTPNRKKCGFEPGVAFRVWRGDKAADVLLCFKCDVLWMHLDGAAIVNTHHEWKDFDPVRPDLLSLAKEAFPADAAIQALPAKSP
jgi:hypothetical protein